MSPNIYMLQLNEEQDGFMALFNENEKQLNKKLNLVVR